MELKEEDQIMKKVKDKWVFLFLRIPAVSLTLALQCSLQKTYKKSNTPKIKTNSFLPLKQRRSDCSIWVKETKHWLFEVHQRHRVAQSS